MNVGYEYRERIGAPGVGMSVLSYLSWRYPHTTRQIWEERILEGHVLLDGFPPEPHLRVTAGQLLIWRRPPWEEPYAPLSFAILYRDEHLLGVLKPSGLPTLPGGGYLEHTLLALVRQKFPDASPVHRIGRPTTGLVLCVRTAQAANLVSCAWARREIRKFYRALVRGHPWQERFSVDVPIGRIAHRVPFFKAHAAAADGRHALSHVRVLEHRQDTSLVEVEIVTGRPHQARIHLAAAGHPLAGDLFYGAGGAPISGTRALPGDGGLFLHAHRLILNHPLSGERLELEAPPPRELRATGER